MKHPSTHQIRLAARIDVAFRRGGAEACTARALYASPEGAEYKRLAALVEAGLVEEISIRSERSGRICSAWIPASARTSSALSELV